MKKGFKKINRKIFYEDFDHSKDFKKVLIYSLFQYKIELAVHGFLYKAASYLRALVFFKFIEALVLK